LSVPINPFEVHWCETVTFTSAQCHPGLTYIFDFWHSGTLAPDCPSERNQKWRL